MIIFLNIAVILIGTGAVLSAFGGKTWRDGSGPIHKRITNRGWISLACLALSLTGGVVREVVTKVQSQKRSEESNQTVPQMKVLAGQTRAVGESLFSGTPAPFATSLDTQRKLIAKVQIEWTGTPSESGAAVYVGNADGKSFLIVPLHLVLHDSDKEPVDIRVRFYSDPRSFIVKLMPTFNQDLDLGVLAVASNDIPKDMPVMLWSEPVVNTSIHVIGFPSLGDWSSWTGMVISQTYEGNPQLLATNRDYSLTAEYTGGPLFDRDGNFLGMHVASTSHYGLALKSEDIIRQLAAWGIPTNNLAKSHGEIPRPVPLMDRVIHLDFPHASEVFAIVLLGVSWALYLYKFPLQALAIDERLRKSPNLKPPWLGGIEIPLRYALLVAFFSYRQRVLDAWVKKNLLTFRERFSSLDTVSEHQLYIGVPAYLDGKPIPRMEEHLFKSAFTRARTRILIWGEGGIGKTSLACQIARWAMESTYGDRLADQPMLPIILEEDLAYERDKEFDSLIRAVRDKLSQLVDDDSAPSQELVSHLLRRHRILLIIDGFSEFSEESRSKLLLGSADFPAKRLIVTSRQRESFGQLTMAVQPMRVKPDQLYSFMDSYLIHRGTRNSFIDKEFIRSLDRLSVILDGKDSTPLLAKLYADLMIAQKEDQNETELPQSVPDIILKYVSTLNRNAKATDPDDRTIHRAAKLIAWECLRDTFQPRAADIDSILKSLEGLPQPESLLKYLEKRLRILQVVGFGKSAIKFALDPLAEYLASMYLVDTYREDEDKWAGFLKRAKQISGQSSRLEGFLSTIGDCCSASDLRFEIPPFVIEVAKNGLSFEFPNTDVSSESLEETSLDPNIGSLHLGGTHDARGVSATEQESGLSNNTKIGIKATLGLKNGISEPLIPDHADNSSPNRREL